MASPLQQPASRQDGVEALFQLRRIHLAEGGAEAEVFLHTHLGIERYLLRQIAERAAGGKGVFDYVVAGDPGGSRCRGEAAGQNPHRGTLLGAVRAEEAEDLTAGDVEGDVRNSRARAVALGKVPDFYQRMGIPGEGIVTLAPAETSPSITAAPAGPVPDKFFRYVAHIARSPIISDREVDWRLPPATAHGPPAPAPPNPRLEKNPPAFGGNSCTWRLR